MHISAATIQSTFTLMDYRIIKANDVIKMVA